MSRAERLELLVRIVRDRPGITARQVAQQLGVHERSVFRDVASLRERGYPIGASRGRGGGLRLHPRWGLGRISFVAEEAIGVLLSLAIAEHVGLPMFGQDWKSVRSKLVAAFPDAERTRLKQLRTRIIVGAAASAQVRASYQEPDVQGARRLQAAFVRARIILFEYDKPGGARTRRRVEPHALLLNWPAWYILGYDHARSDARTFRLDRIAAVAVEKEEFKPRPHAIVRALAGLEHADPDRWSL